MYYENVRETLPRWHFAIAPWLDVVEEPIGR